MKRPEVLAWFAGVVLLAFAIGLAWLPETTMAACRVTNVALGLIAALGFYVRVNDAWKTFPLGSRILCGGITGVFCICAAGSAEAYLAGAELGYRAVALNLALVTCIAGLLLGRDDR